MASARRLLLSLVLLATAAATRRKEASHASITPVEQVIQLLEDMKTKVEGEGSAEAGTYDTFACFCRDTTQTKSTSITTGNDNIDRLSADIQADTATKATKATELADRKRQQEELAAELSDTQARCLSEMAGFEASIADLSKAVRSLTKAIDAMRNSMPSSLLSVRQSVSDSLALADAMGLVVKSRRPAIEAFLQAHVDPSDPGYKYHSNEIITTLENLKTDFTTRQTDTQSEWDKARTACNTLKTDLGNQMSTNSGTMTTLSQDMDALATTIASNRESLVNAESLLQDDQLYLKDLTQQCEARAKDWDQRSQMRADEITALTSALAILKDGADGRRSVKDLDAVNQRALLLQRPRAALAAATAVVPTVQVHTGISTAEVPVPLLLQEVAVQSGAHGRGLRGGQHTAAVSAHSMLHRWEESAQRRALVLLRSEGKRLGSGMLMALASQAAADPFAKVKNLIQRLIERLLAEATQEATKKGFCDEEIGKATKARDFRLTDTKKLAAEIGQLNAKKDELETEIGQLNVSLADLRNTLNETQVLRDAEHTENLNATETAREGLAAIKQAITILKVFYSQAARATVLTQASPVNATPGFQGAYKGNQDGSVGVIRMLEVIKSDFERTIRTTAASEEAAAAAFVEFDRTSKADISGKEMTMQRSQEDLEKTRNGITQKMADLDSAQQLLDSALRTIEDLKPMCIDTTMSFAERKAKREEEIAALKTALCHLDPNQVESECQGQGR